MLGEKVNLPKHQLDHFGHFIGWLFRKLAVCRLTIYLSLSVIKTKVAGLVKVSWGDTWLVDETT